MKPQTTDAEDLRKRQIAKIHCLIKALGLDDDTYRAILSQVVGVDSSKDLDQAGRERLLDHLEGLRKKLSKGSERSRAKEAPAPLSSSPQGRQVRKIRALWGEMAQAGYLKGDGSERALNRFVERVAGVARVEWLLDARKANAVIEALKSWKKREAQKRSVQEGESLK